MELVTDWSGRIEVRRRRQKCRVLLIDETSIRKRHRYVTVVVNGDTGEVLAMFPERSKASLSRFFIEQGPRWCHSVRTVVTDGSHSYRAAIHRYLPGSRPGPVGCCTPRTATPPTPRSYEPDLFRGFGDHLTPRDQRRLQRPVRVWPALQELYGLYEANDLQGALEGVSGDL